MNEEDELELLKLDYGKTSEHFRMLADVRFKLLALVPTLAGAAIVVLSGASARAESGVGVLGWFVTVGLILYELRNSQLYDAAVQRLKCLEFLLRFPATQAKAKVGALGGVHRERPKRRFPIIHDLALGVVYGASLAGWTFLALDGLKKRDALDIHSDDVVRATLVVGVLVLLVFWVHDCWILGRLRKLPARYEDDQSRSP